MAKRQQTPRRIFVSARHDPRAAARWTGLGLLYGLLFVTGVMAIAAFIGLLVALLT